MAGVWFWIGTHMADNKLIFRIFEGKFHHDPWVNFLNNMPITLFYTFGNMLIGLILGKLDFFSPPWTIKKINKYIHHFRLFCWGPLQLLFSSGDHRCYWFGCSNVMGPLCIGSRYDFTEFGLFSSFYKIISKRDI